MRQEDHHSMELREKWKRTRQQDYQAVKDESEERKALQPNFWLWAWVNPRRFMWLCATALLMGIAAAALLADEGLITLPWAIEDQLIYVSTVSAILATLDVAAMVVSWRCYKHRPSGE